MVVPALPFDAVEEILSHLSVKSPKDEEAYYEAQAALRQCCLVSKAFDSVTRPLLWRTIRFDHSQQFQKAEEEVKKDDALRRFSRVVSVKPVEVDVWDTLELLELLPEVEWVVLVDLEENVKLAWLLDRFSKCRHISLSTTWLDEIPLLFPNLVTLSLASTHVSAEYLRLLVSPRTTPALRALRLEEVLDPEADLARVDLSACDLDRLDSLQPPIDYIIPPSPPGTIFPLARTLFTISLDMPFPSLDHDGGDLLRLGDVGFVLEYVKQKLLPSSRMTTLFLPFDLPHGRLDRSFVRGAYRHVAHFVEALLAACEKQGVEVFWRKGGFEEDSRLNRDSWAYARRVRMEEGAGEA
ncbi:hypothetical protein JCM8547_005452 [Rhodosporidiobolus lusitaniae]